MYILTCTRTHYCIGSTDYLNNIKSSTRLALHSISIKLYHSTLSVNFQSITLAAITIKNILLESKDITCVDYRSTFTRLWLYIYKELQLEKLERERFDIVIVDYHKLHTTYIS